MLAVKNTAGEWVAGERVKEGERDLAVCNIDQEPEANFAKTRVYDARIDARKYIWQQRFFFLRQCRVLPFK